MLHGPAEELTAAAGAASHGAAHGSMGHGEGRGMSMTEKLIDPAVEWVEIGCVAPSFPFYHQSLIVRVGQNHDADRLAALGDGALLHFCDLLAQSF